MRINIYTEEMHDMSAPAHAEIVTADYISSRTGYPMTNYGLRLYFHSTERLHYLPGRDDDRSAVTFWCGPDKSGPEEFLKRALNLIKGKAQ